MTPDKTTKLVIALGLAALVVATGGVGYVVYQQKNTLAVPKTAQVPIKTPPISPTETKKTSDLKTYTNSALGFSFEYPAGWNLDESVRDEDKMLYYIHLKTPIADNTSYDMGIAVMKNPDILTAKEWVEDMLSKNNADSKEGSAPPIRYQKEQSYDVGGLETAYGLYGVFSGDQLSELVYYTVGDVAYEFSFPIGMENPNLLNPVENHEKVLNILASFRVISAIGAIVPSTESWKTYTNEKYGFTLTFPDNWKGYTVSNRDINWGSDTHADFIEFGFGQSSLFGISVQTKEEWKDVTALGWKDLTYITENDRYVFSYSIGNGIVDDGPLGGGRSDVRGIVKTFKIMK